MSNSSIDSKFEQLTGLATAKMAISRIPAMDGGAHAVLLYGPEGAGKRTLGMILANCWLCKSPTEGLACGQCPACVSFENGLNADLFVLEPTGEGDSIKVESISDGRKTSPGEVYTVQKFLRTLPMQSRTKVLFIEDCHRLTLQAQHAILKTLEEPEPYARFVLTTNRLPAVLPTVRSRCNAVPCGVPDDLGTDGLRLSPGERARFESKEGFLSTILNLAAEVLEKPGAALKCSDAFRDAVDDAKESDDGSKRALQSDALGVLAEAFRRLGDFEAASLTANAHRRVRANGHFAIVTDSLFTRIATQSYE